MNMRTEHSTAHLRHYLEQMMLCFLASKTPMPVAADHLGEIESHCIEAGIDGPADPTELFGDPIDLADSLRVPPTLRDFLEFGAASKLISVGMLCALLLGDQQVDTSFVVLGLIGIGLVAIVLMLTNRPRALSERSESRKPFGVAAAIIAGVTVAETWLITSLFPSGQIPLRFTWLLAGLVIGFGSLVALAQAARRRMRTEAISPQPIGVTADIIEDIATNGHWEGWLKYDVDGQPLEDRTARDTIRKMAAHVRELYRQIRSSLDG